MGVIFYHLKARRSVHIFAYHRRVDAGKIYETVNYYQLFMEIFVNYFTGQHLQLLEKYGKINSPTNGNYLQFVV